MNTLEIDNCLRANDHTAKIFCGVYPSDMLPHIKEYPCGFIANVSESRSRGMHWVSIFAEKSSIILFDSFAPYTVVNCINIQDYLRKNIANEHKQVIYNTEQIQSDFSSVCGYYACLHLLSASQGMKFKDFLAQFEDINSHVINDYRATYMFKKSFAHSSWDSI